MRKILLSGLIIVFIFSIIYYFDTPLKSQSINNSANISSATFADYWYQGKAEINRFDLQQVRYGEIREGDAVLIYVTEDFLPQSQVKFESKETSEIPVSILKLNFTRKFDTGIYPYSMMTSVFTPIDHNNNNTLKVTCTVQEWCGHSFIQLNRHDDGYYSQIRSYFQAEGDQEKNIDRAIPEDELWTRIRLNPGILPLGDIDLIPGTQYLRFTHNKIQGESAMTHLKKVNNSAYFDDHHFKYTIIYKNIPRKLVIYFESEFPHRIFGWEESDRSPEGLITSATRTHSMLLDYWSKNSNADHIYREKLGLN